MLCLKNINHYSLNKNILNPDTLIQELEYVLVDFRILTRRE